MIPKREQIKLSEKKATFEQLDKQAEQVNTLLFFIRNSSRFIY